MIEQSGGPKGAQAKRLLLEAGNIATTDSQSPEGQGLIGQAWRTGTRQTSPAFGLDPRLDPWKEQAQSLGIRSSAAIPLKNESGQSEAILILLGEYPNMFESPWMTQFQVGIEQRLGKVLTVSRPVAGGLPEEAAIEYRNRLYSGGLSMHLQPLFDLRTGEVVKVEALARITDQKGSLIYPGEFLPAFGNRELDHLFRTGLQETLSWLSLQDNTRTPVGVSLNLSPSTLRHPELPLWVNEALSTHGISPDRLTLEILESSQISEKDEEAMIARLLKTGIRLSMDDLGSGYSSLLRLSRLPFSDIKVDQGLLKHLRKSPLQIMSMIRTIIRMGTDLGCTVFVEGLEDPGMVETATFLGASHGQGYAMARPMTKEQFHNFHSGTPFTPARTTSIRTTLGALAYHWRLFHHDDAFSELLPLSNCPMTGFFKERDDLKEGDLLHRAVHETEGNTQRENSRKLIDWLILRVQEEDMVKDPPSA